MEELKEYVIQQLLDTKPGEQLKKGLESLEKAQLAYCRLNDGEDSEYLQKIKLGTVLTFAVLEKMALGKKPEEFTKEDWSQIANVVVDYGIIMEGQEYTKWIFQLYIKYIEASVEKLPEYVPEEKKEQIGVLAEEIRIQTERFDQGEISEPKYVDECMWLCLEAMVKLLSACISISKGEEFTELAQASAMLAFEYARYAVYKYEDDALTEYLIHQDEVDDELQIKLDSFMDEFKKQSDEFMDIVDKAFSENVREKMSNSIELARRVGLSESDVLATVEDVDDFFM